MSDPIDMILHCPMCKAQHVDAPEPASGWANPPHKSHLCHACGAVWRPADVPTNGVAAIKTRGDGDTFPVPPKPPRPLCKCDRCGKQLHTGSTGNFAYDKAGALVGVCYTC